MTDPGTWLINTAKRNPEAMLVLGAGLALLLRGMGSRGEAEIGGGFPPSTSDASRPAQTATTMIGSLKDRVSDAGASVTGRAGEMARTLSEQTSQVASQAQSTMSSSFAVVVRQQPLALVAVGLAAGAAVAALLPATDLEEDALGASRDAVSSMAGKVGGNLVAAATDAGQRLVQGVADQASESLSGLAQQVVGQLTNKGTDSPSTSAAKPAEKPNVRPLSDRSS
ncbi:MAG: hypothetical protein JO001_12600 [Alphaproteobacteria bacterium]|nr:hypothetical protein [Alphaproteobacteria bacterium]